MAGLATVAVADPPGTYIVDTPAEAAAIGASGYSNSNMDLIIQISITPITQSKLNIQAKSITIASGVNIINETGATSELTLYAKSGSVLIDGAVLKARNMIRIWSDGVGNKIVINGSEIVSSSTLLPDDPAANKYIGNVYISATGNVEIEHSTIWGHSKLVVISNNASVIWHDGGAGGPPGGGPGGGPGATCVLKGFCIVVDASERNTIYKFDAAGNVLPGYPIILTPPSAKTFVPTDLICDGTGYLVLNWNHPVALLKYDAAGTLLATSKNLKTAGGADVIHPTGFAIDGDALWVVSQGDRVLLRYSLADAFAGPGDITPLETIAFPPGILGHPESLALDSTYFYMLDDGNPDRIYRYRRDKTGTWEPSKALKTPTGVGLDKPKGIALMCGTYIWVLDNLDHITLHTVKNFLKYELASLWPANGDTVNALEMVSVVTSLYTDDWPEGICLIFDEEPPGNGNGKSGGGHSETQISARINVDIEGLVLKGYSHLNLFATLGDLLAHGANLTFEQFNISIGGNVDISDATLIAAKNLRLDAGGNVNAFGALMDTVGTSQPVLNKKAYPNWVQPPVITNPGTVVGLGAIRIGTGGNSGVIDVRDATLD